MINRKSYNKLNKEKECDICPRQKYSIKIYCQECQMEKYRKKKENYKIILLITGSRSIENYKFVFSYLNKTRKKINFTEIIVGDAEGVDFLCVLYALYHNIPYHIEKAYWNKYGKSAGPIRNNIMVKKCTFGIGIYDGTNNKKISKGTKHCIGELKKQNKLLRVFKYENI